MVDIRPLGNTDDIQREADERKLDAQLAPLPARATKPIDTESMEYIFTYKLPLTNYLLAAFYVQIIVLFLLAYIGNIITGRGLEAFPSLEPWGGPSGYVLVGAAGLLTLVLLSRVSFLRYVAIVVAVGCIGYVAYSVSTLISLISSSGVAGVFRSLAWNIPYLILIFLLGATIIHLLRPKIARLYKK